DRTNAPPASLSGTAVASALQLLLIEDSRDDEALVVRALSHGGHEVHAARVEDPEALTAALERQSWDIAIASSAMSGFPTSTVFEVIRQCDADLPCIVLSSASGEDAAVAAMRTGARDYILKSQIERLAPAVERELVAAATRRERRRVEERIAHLAYHDALTDLPNRLLLHDRL